MSNKIALISPRGAKFFKDDNINADLKKLPGYTSYHNYWSGLGTALPIIASLTDDYFEVEIIDENQEEINFNADYCLVGVTAMTQQAIRAYQICSEFKKKGIHTVIGGIHPTVMHLEAKMFADTVVIGEAENSWPQLLEDFKGGKIKSVYHQTDYGDVDITKSPVPRYDLITGKNYKVIWINTQRGCPYDCEFCSVTSFYGKKNRNKKIDQIINEMLLIKKLFNRTSICLSDDNMFLNRKFTYELIENIQDLNVRWDVESDISIGEDSAFLENLYKAGCHSVFIGFESLSRENLSSIYKSGKKLKMEYLSKYPDMVKNIQDHGIGVFGSFIVGLDFDKNDCFDKIIDFIYETNMLSATINILTPLPGTHLRERLLAENRIFPASWDNYTFRDINYIPKNISIYDLEKGIVEAYNKIFSIDRIKRISNHFNEIYKKLYS